MPSIYIIAGPNGAGKTTVAYSLLPNVFNIMEFVNADEIAKGLSPFNFEGVTFQAGRIMIGRLYDLLNQKKNFAFETTLSGRTYLQLIQHAKNNGYSIVLFFIWLENKELAKSRVAARVAKGGHNIPESIIEQRYIKGVRNFSEYAKLSDDWFIYDNSGPLFILIANKIEGKEEVFNFEIYNKIVSLWTYQIIKKT